MDCRMINKDLLDFYNSSPMREGVLCWYPFDKNASVLDMSNGALTELLRSRCGRVVSDIHESRNGFDYVIVIDPVDFSTDSLKTLRERLNEHGRLLLAYENPFALRYWNGKRSPVTGVPYDTLFGCDGRISKAEMQIRLKLAGFEGQKWYYPLTDHWFAREIYSENYLPDEYLNQRFKPYLSDDVTLKFDERHLYREVIRGGAFEFMCGAYLIEARANACDAPCVVDYAAITAFREPPKRFATTVRSDGKVIKTPLHPDGIESITRIYNNHKELAGLGLNIVPVELYNNSLVMQKIGLPTLWDYWVRKLINGAFDFSEMSGHFDMIYEDIKKAAKTGKCYWELVPANCFYDAGRGRITYFDQEYYWEGSPPEIAMARALWALNYSPAFSADPRTASWLESLKERYGLTERWDELSNLADLKTLSEVFGVGDINLEQITRSAISHIQNYQNLNPIATKLGVLGFKRPLVYGYGVRGKRICRILHDHGIKSAAVYDREFHIGDSLSSFSGRTDADIVVVSIQGGEYIAMELRGILTIPVFTVEELLNEQP